jgi:hypothetical protein
MENKQDIEEMKIQRILGLEKLADASIQVERLKKELIVKDKEILIATAASTEVCINDILFFYLDYLHIYYTFVFR